jgi:hypothetical protein
MLEVGIGGPLQDIGKLLSQNWAVVDHLGSLDIAVPVSLEARAIVFGFEQLSTTNKYTLVIALARLYGPQPHATSI